MALLVAIGSLSSTATAETAGSDTAHRPPLTKSIEDPGASSLAATGAMGDLTVGASFLGGRVTKRAGIDALQVSAGIRGGYHFTRHVGAFVGLELGHGALVGDCYDVQTGGPSLECKVYSVRLPILVEVTFTDRSRGPYLTAGATAFDVVGITAANGSVVLWNPVAASLGLGVRTPVVLDPAKKGKPNILDFRARVDAGSFLSADGNAIPADQRALYATVTVSGGWVF